MNPTAYELLGVAPNASAEDIEAAYQTQAAEVDPALLKERATGATAFRYKMLTEAYARLSEPERRLAYDLGLRYHFF